MISLGSKFPEGLARESIERQLKPGIVVRIEIHFPAKSKQKFVVISATADGYYLGFYINSEIHSFISSRESMNKCQVLVDSENHPFLSYDSYIACHEVARLKKEDVLAELVDDASRIQGPISAETKDQMVSAIKFAETIDNQTKEILIFAFDQN